MLSTLRNCHIYIPIPVRSTQHGLITDNFLYLCPNHVFSHSIQHSYVVTIESAAHNYGTNTIWGSNGCDPITVVMGQSQTTSQWYGPTTDSVSIMWTNQIQCLNNMGQSQTEYQLYELYGPITYSVSIGPIKDIVSMIQTNHRHLLNCVSQSQTAS